MTNRPKLAVVISCYNYEGFVGRAIESVLRQGRSDCELVVVDDGSIDRSWEVITQTGVTAFRTENGGQLAACLHGLDRTRAPFVLFLDADDELKPGALDTIVERLDPGVAKLQFALTHIDADGRPIGRASSLDSYRRRRELVDRVLRSGVYKTPPTSGNVFRRDVCELLREVNYDRAVDGVILFAAPLFGDIVSIADELGNYRIHGGNDSGLGRGPEAAILDRDIARFVARMGHLRAILQRFDTDRKLIDPRETYYFRELNFYLDVVKGRRPGMTDLLRLLRALVKEPPPFWNKLLRSLFFVALAALPANRAGEFLSFRLNDRDRSLKTFLRGAMVRRVAVS
ncbi:MAG: pssF [Phenylobacterium sp.]|nr:pssF [Phenylobacterium sp.]